MSEEFVEGYEPIFELGLFEEVNPAIKVLHDADICPTVLAALTTALFETVMRTVADSKQIEFESKYLKSLQVLMSERFNYDVTVRYPKSNE